MQLLVDKLNVKALLKGGRQRGNKRNLSQNIPCNYFTSFYLFLVMTEETITELVHVAYDEEFDNIKVSF